MKAIHHVAIQVRSLPVAEAFYAGLLGLPVIARHAAPDGSARAVWVGLADGSFLALERASGEREPQSFRDGRPGLHLLAFVIQPAERDALAAKLSAAGHALEAETSFTFYVLDPEGNRVGFSHHPTPRS